MQQLDSMDCGAACLRMVAAYYGRRFSLAYFRNLCCTTREGVSLLSIAKAAERIGLRATGVRLPLERLSYVNLPCVAHWDQKHFVVIVAASQKRIRVADPGVGIVDYAPDDFKKHWLSLKDAAETRGICLLLEPTPAFASAPEEEESAQGPRFLWPYLRPFRRLAIPLIIGVIITTTVQLGMPLLMQALMDIGIANREPHFILILILARLAFAGGQLASDLLRSWILLQASSRAMLNLMADFLSRLLRMPIPFFESKTLGDLLQRIDDHSRLEEALTGRTPETLFFLSNLVVFGGVLVLYSRTIALIYFVGSALQVLWAVRFLRPRRSIEAQRFSWLSRDRVLLVESIQGIQDIRLANAAQNRRWRWERVRAQLFRVNIRLRTMANFERVGASIIAELRSSGILLLGAFAVIHGEITIGMLIAIQYIVGQLNGRVGGNGPGWL